jgi:hypothetical protein
MVAHEIGKDGLARLVSLIDLDRFRKLSPYVEADRRDEDAQDEGHTPTPVVELIPRKGWRQNHSIRLTMMMASCWL